MANQGYYNQGPQYPQQRCVLSFTPCPLQCIWRGRLHANRTHKDERKECIKETSRLTCFRLQLRRRLPSSTRLSSPAIWWIQPRSSRRFPTRYFLISRSSPSETWRQAYHREYLDVCQMGDRIQTTRFGSKEEADMMELIRCNISKAHRSKSS